MKGEFKITEDFSGFSISIGVGRIFNAKNLKELTLAIEHYFGTNKTDGHCNRKRKNCPLCDK